MNLQKEAIIDRISDAVFALDANFCFTYLNKQALEVICKKEDELIGQHILYAPLQNISEILLDNCKKARLLNKTISIQEIGDKKGIWYEKTIYPSASGLTILFKDITTEKQKEERFTLATLATNDMIWDWNLQTNELWWNYNYNSLFGYNNNSPIHHINDWVDKVHEEDRERVRNGIYKIIEENKSFWSDEYRYLKGDGTFLNVYDRGYVAYNENGKAYRMIGSMLDITQRIKAEAAVRESEERYRTLVEQASDAIYIVNKSGTFLQVNHAACLLSLYTEEELLQKNISDILYKDDLENMPFRISDLEDGNAIVSHRRFVRKDGKILYSESNAKMLADGRILVIARDITDRLKQEERLKKSHEDSRSLASHLVKLREEERKRIGREIHDELGQKLTAIKMDVSWLDKKLPGDIDIVKEKIRNMILLLDEGNKSVRKILSELSPAVLDDNDLLDALLRQNKQFTETTAIPLTFNSNVQVITLTETIANGIFRIYQESLTNIMKYANATDVNVDFVCSYSQIEIKIVDNGVGFEVSKVSTKKSFGLIGMKERVLSLGGTFSIKSTKNIGTEISFTIPILKN